MGSGAGRVCLVLAESLPGTGLGQAQWEATQVWVQIPSGRTFLTA